MNTTTIMPKIQNVRHALIQAVAHPQHCSNRTHRCLSHHPIVVDFGEIPKGEPTSPITEAPAALTEEKVVRKELIESEPKTNNKNPEKVTEKETTFES